MKKLILAIFLILPFAVNAEDLTAEVKLYETDENGHEIKLTEPTKVENDYTYTARIKSNENDIYYLKVKPNYEYTSIKYETLSGSVTGKYQLASDSTQPFFKAWTFCEQGDTFIATVTKTDNTEVKYRIVVAPYADKTIYIDTVEDTNNNQVIENNQTVENNNNQKATSNNVKNPNTGDNILLMSGMFVLVTTIIGVSFKKIKSNS
ncbi:MAG: hypothetical protein V8Q71_04535 [Bacilli bacterium]